jgi:flagellar protein FliS
MWNSGHDAYLESKVLAADPVELVSLLYNACAQAVRESRRYLAAGQVVERSREINKACAIVIELVTSLDHERGGEISQRLAFLYDYMQRRLLQANMQQSDAPLADVLGLITTLSEAWAGVRQPQEKPGAESSKSQPAADNRWTQSATENPASQPPAQNAWSQPAADNRWTQSATESPASQPPAQNAWSQPAADNRWNQSATESPASQPATENPPSQPPADNPWSPPTPEVDDYRLRAFSF